MLPLAGRSSLILGLALAGLASGELRAEDLSIWVAPGLYGYSESNCSPRSADSPAATTQIDPRLCDVLDPTASDVLTAHFKREMQAAFGARVVEKPGANLPDAIAQAQRLRSTLAASLHISRASIWTVSQNNGANTVYIPITITLGLTNIVSGEVLFTQRLSAIKPLTAEDRNVARFAREQLPDHLLTAISELVQQSAGQFKPYPVSATVRGAVGNRYVIDRGKAAGIRSGDLFEGDVKVLFADGDYAIVQPVIPDQKLKDEAVLSKQNVEPASYLAKHSAMVVNGATPEGMSPNYLKRIFEDKLGATAAFNISYVNPAIEAIRRAAAGEALSNANRAEREAPDYFVYFETYALDPTRFPTNIPGRFIKTYEAYAVAYITDRSGRVVYAQVASDRLTDEDSGIGFAVEQRQETAVANAIDKVVALIGAEFKPSSLRLPVLRAGGALAVADPGGVLSAGAVGTVLRKAGQFKGIKVGVWEPVNDSRIVGGDAQAVLEQTDPLGRAAMPGDLFAVESGGEVAGGTREAFGACPAQEGLPPGDLSASGLLRSIGLARFYQAKRVPLYLENLPDLLRRPLRNFRGGGAGLGAIEPRQASICIKTIVRISPEGPVKSKNNYRSDRYNSIFGYNLIGSSNERISGFGTSIAFETSPVPGETPELDISRSVTREVVRTFSANAKVTADSVSLVREDK